MKPLILRFMKVDTGFDPNLKKVVIRVETPLFEKYYSNFKGLIESKENKGLPEGISCEKSDFEKHVALVSFPFNKKNGEGAPSPAGTIAVRVDIMKAIHSVINRFATVALSKELKSTEFIPLSGYEVAELKKDVQKAVQGKRDFCIIKNYKEYTDSVNNPEKKDAYKFHQYVVKYDTEEYANVAINLYEGEIDVLRAKYEPKLTLTNWI